MVYLTDMMPGHGPIVLGFPPNSDIVSSGVMETSQEIGFHKMVPIVYTMASISLYLPKNMQKIILSLALSLVILAIGMAITMLSYRSYQSSKIMVSYIPIAIDTGSVSS